MNQLPAGPAPLVAQGRAVQLHLRVRFEDGFDAFSTFGQAPIACTIGDGTFTPAFEAMIAGLAPGEDVDLVADGSDLFGAHDSGNLHWLGLDEFPPDLTPVPGLVVGFSTPAGEDINGIVLGLDGERVQVDFNHPFSGRTLAMRIEVLTVD